MTKTNVQLLTNTEIEEECHSDREQVAKLKLKNRKRLIIIGTALLGGITVGTLGYKFLAPMSTSEAFLNATMILSGMGPVDSLANSNQAKIFASFFALFSGAFFLIVLSFLVQSIFLTIVEQDRLAARCNTEKARKSR